MSISAEEKNRYFREAAIALAKEGFQSDEIHADRLCVLFDGSPLCEVTESGGVAYRNEDIDEPERIAAKDKVYEIVKTTAEYMRQMETAPFLKADGLEDGYKVLADFNGTVLAGAQSKHGVHFVTWDWAYGHTGVCHGHYFIRLEHNKGDRYMKNKALVVIDIQNDITKNYREIVENLNKAIDWAIEQEMYVVYICQNNITPSAKNFLPGKKGAEIVPELHVASDHIFIKTKTNALTSEAFCAFIEENSITEFVITGADATACVKSICYNMTKAGYAVTVLSDCVTSYDKKKIPVMLEYYKSKNCIVVTLDQMVATSLQ